MLKKTLDQFKSQKLIKRNEGWSSVLSKDEKFK